MTTYLEAKDAMIAEYVTNTTLDTTPVTGQVTLENEQWKPPTDTPWVRVSVRHFDGGQDSLGGVGFRKFSRVGSLFVQIFIPQDTGGTAPADTIAQEARTLLEGKALTGTTIKLLTSQIRELGQIDGDFVVVVETGFEYIETR